MWKYLNKGISTPVALIIILILAASVGGYTLWQYTEIQKEKTEPMSEIKIPEKQNETSDWETYTNDKAKYELKYPPDFEVKEPEYTATAEFIDVVKKNFPGWYTIESHWILNPKGEVTAKQLVESLSNENKIITNFNINGVPAIKVTADSPLGGKFTEIYIEKYGDVYIISYSSDNELGLKYFNQILSTFRFIE